MHDEDDEEKEFFREIKNITKQKKININNYKRMINREIHSEHIFDGFMRGQIAIQNYFRHAKIFLEIS